MYYNCIIDCESIVSFEGTVLKSYQYVRSYILALHLFTKRGTGHMIYTNMPLLGFFVVVYLLVISFYPIITHVADQQDPINYENSSIIYQEFAKGFLSHIFYVVFKWF